MLENFVSEDNWKTQIVTATAGVVFLYVAVKKTSQYLKNRSTRKFYKKKIQKKRAELQLQTVELEKKLEVNGVLLTDERKYILSLAPEALLQELKEGKLTSVNVLRAYQAKAIEVTRRLNCITEFVREAEDYARLLDEMPDQLPLHGIPFSIKEEFAMKNYDSVAGIAKFIGKPNTKDAVMITALRRAGAVPFCRTNIPQVICSYSSVNPVFGFTRNPYDSDRTSGGSSSGEGALIGAGGSILGLGSDLGGSVRIPAHFCGIASLKPTSGRLSTIGEIEVIIPGIQGRKLTPGMMGKDVDILIATYKALYDDILMNKVHPLALPLSWRHDLFDTKRPLKIGVMYDFSLCPATPGCLRAVRLAVAAFRKAGHTVIPFEITADETLSILQGSAKATMANNAIPITKLLENEEIPPGGATVFQKSATPECIRKCINAVLSPLGLVPKMTNIGATKSIDLMNVLHERDILIRTIVGRWRDADIDVWLVPAFPFPAPPPTYPALIGDALLYTGTFSYLDFPAGIVPTTVENSDDQRELEEYNRDGNRVQKHIKEATRGAEGLPIGVQIVGLPWTDELVLRAMKELQDTLRN